MSDNSQEMKKRLDEILKKEHDERIEEAKLGTEAYKKQLQNDRSAVIQEEHAKIANQVNTVDDRGNQTTLWRLVEAKADAILSPERQSYQDWQSAMTALLALYCDLAKALAQSRREWITGPLSEKLTAGVIIPIQDWINGDPSNPEDIKIEIPTLRHLVNFNEKNELIIEPLERSDGVMMDGKLNSLYEEGVMAWMNEVGYKPRYPDNPENKEFVDQNNVIVTKADFDLMKNDPDYGLNQYLSGQDKMSFSPR